MTITLEQIKNELFIIKTTWFLTKVSPSVLYSEEFKEWLTKNAEYRFSTLGYEGYAENQNDAILINLTWGGEQ